MYKRQERGREYIAKYEQFHDKMDAKACMFGRVTFMDWPWQLAPENKPELPENVPHIDRTDYVADVKADKYCVAIDQSGKLAWGANVMLRGSSDIYTNRVGDHIISVLTEKVSDAYLHYLRNMKVSYIFGGKETLDFRLVVEKLYALDVYKRQGPESPVRFSGNWQRQGCGLRKTTPMWRTGTAAWRRWPKPYGWLALEMCFSPRTGDRRERSFPFCA